MLLSIQVAFFEVKQVDIFIESHEELSAEIPTIYAYGTPAISDHNAAIGAGLNATLFTSNAILTAGLNPQVLHGRTWWKCAQY
jgi:hypothetical protein